ncbi:cytochrome P450 [Mycena vulgaris]|nr:cytochrome P450 [Mycena vulgaris]
MPSIIFHLHGQDLANDGVAVEVLSSDTIEQLRKIVAEKLSVALPATISFHQSVNADAAPGDLEQLETVDSILAAGSVAILISGKKVRPVPGPTGGIPFIGGYSEIYPDFIGNYQRLLHKYGHIVHVGYLGKSIYLTDDPDCAGVVLSESEFYSKQISENHPLVPLKMSLPNGIFTADSSNPAWSTSHKFMMTAMGATAMRTYVRTMDQTAKRLVQCFDQLREQGKSFNAFPWALRAAAQTIGEVALGIDYKMLDNMDSSIANIFLLIGRNLKLAQALFRKGRIYRTLPNPERRAQKAAEEELSSFVDAQTQRVLQEGSSPDMPYHQAAVATSSLLDYMLHATDEEGNKMDIDLVQQNVITFLLAGQVTTSSALSWLWFCLSTFPVQARKLHASLVTAGLSAEKEITADQLGKLEYLDWFIKETQRLYNPAFQPTRQAMKGMSSDHRCHHAWRYPRSQGCPAYIPFAAGGRSCIGFNFALQEIKIILARIVLNFQIENTTDGPVIYDPEFSLYRPLNFTMKLRKQVDPSAVKLDEPPRVEAKLQAPTPPVGTKALPRFWALHASNNGTCQGMADDAAAKAQQLGFADVQVVALADSPLADPKTSAEIGAGPNFFVICVATYNGEPPDAALSFSEILDAEIKAGNDARFGGINYCVFGAGNTQWGPTYQAFPKKLDANMAALGGNRMFEKGSGDANGDQDGQFTEWVTKLLAATAANFGINVNEIAQGGEGTDNVLTSSLEYSADSVKVVFLQQPFATDAQSSLMQPPALGFVQATLRANLELVDKDTPLPRGMRLLTFDVPEGFVYRAGDHMEVFPENDPAVVERLLVALNFIADAVFTVKEAGAGSNPKSLAALLLDRGQITLRELLLYYADLSGPVQRGSLQVLCSFLPLDDNFKSLRETLSEASTETGNTFAQKNRNFPALIENYPMLAHILDLQKLLLVLRATQPRRYSIASSPLVDPHIVKLCIGVEDTLVADYEGLCSGFLKRSGVGHVVWVRHRAAQESFHLPSDPATPIILAAAGTGIAPFLGFLEHRRAQGIKIKEHGGEAVCRLFYGTRYHDMSSLRAMVHAYVNDGTVLLETAYSAEDAPRRFAQQILLRDALTVWRDISNSGRVYACGSAARVGQGVQNSLMRIAEQVGGVADPVAWLAGLRKEGCYSEDVFG